MSVAILIVAHEAVARAMVEAAEAIFGDAPLRVRALGVACDCESSAVHGSLQREIEAIDDGDGVLLLTDLFGGTPSNLASIHVDGTRVRMVSGINLPMLVRVMNYPGLGLAALADKAVSGGRDGIVSGSGG